MGTNEGALALADANRDISKKRFAQSRARATLPLHSRREAKQAVFHRHAGRAATVPEDPLTTASHS